MSRTAFYSPSRRRFFPRGTLRSPKHPQLLGGRFDDFEGSYPERIDDSLRELRTDAANHARAEIFLDAFRRGRRGGFEKVGFELQPVSAISRPNADGVYELSRDIEAACPTTVTRSRFPRAFTFKTAKPFSSL